jgi:hypothetical protein
MPNTNPNGIEALLQFAQYHVPVWESNGRVIGVSAEQSASYKLAYNAAQAAFNAAQQGKLTQRALVNAQNEAVRTLRTTNSALLKIIRGFAQDSDNPGEVYRKAEIPPPAVPTPLGPPSTPTDLNAQLDLLVGGLKLTWKAKQTAPGTIYKLERKASLTPNAPYELVALTGSKFATDLTVPVGTSQVFYRVVAQRGNFQSQPSGVLDIRFGTGPGEAVKITQVKLAA